MPEDAAAMVRPIAADELRLLVNIASKHLRADQPYLTIAGGAMLMLFAEALPFTRGETAESTREHMMIALEEVQKDPDVEIRLDPAAVRQAALAVINARLHAAKAGAVA